MTPPRSEKKRQGLGVRDLSTNFSAFTLVPQQVQKDLQKGEALMRGTNGHPSCTFIVPFTTKKKGVSSCVPFCAKKKSNIKAYQFPLAARPAYARLRELARAKDKVD